MLTWKRSSRCGKGANCVEVGHHDGLVLVRDSKNPDAPPHAYTHDEWAAFTAGIKAGEFDLPT